MSQVVAGNPAEDSHVIELRAHRPKAGFDIAQAFPVTQLGEGHHQKLIEARKSFYFVIAAVALGAFAKRRKRQMFHHLGENGFAGIHKPSLSWTWNG